MPFNKPDITQLSALGSTTGDVYFPQTKLLLPFDGLNGATSTTDESNSNLSLTMQGSSTISTAQSKFGGSSLYVPNSNPTGVYTTGAGSTIQLTGDFTFEWWFYRVQVTLVNNMVVGPMYGHSSVSNSTSKGLLVGYVGSSASQTNGDLFASSSGSSWNVASSVDLGTNSMGIVGQWVHMALVRNGSDWSYYVDGTRTYTGSLGSATIAAPGPYILLGKTWTAVNQMEGYWDDFRITQGQARYTSGSFTPPSTAHLTSAGDVNKQIIVNSAADGVAIGTGGINQARIAKAWVNFDGTGTVAIRGSYNVSSITDDGTGDYDINFSTALSDTNYVVVGTVGGSGIVGFKRDQNETRTTNKAGVYSLNGSLALADGPYIEAIVFGN